MRAARKAHDRVIAAPEDPGIALTTRDTSPGATILVVLILACVLAVYWRTTLSMVAIWERSETFAHGFVVIPIFCYLIWRKRHALNALTPTPCWGALVGLVVAGFVWLIGGLVSAASVSQFAMVAMVPFAIWALLGTQVAVTLALPLAFLFFAVPFGEVLVPTMMDWTARFTVAALRASGVPVYQEGNYFIIPSGSWSVVEACSGLRYLIASAMVGCLYAYLSYRSPIRRIAFIGASIVVPIVANWLRAYMIVMIGHLSNNRLAVGVDHLIYGWIFFGVVMVFLLWIGSRWRQDDLGGSDDHPSTVGTWGKQSQIASSRGRLMAAGVGAILAIGIWQPLFAHFDASGPLGAVDLDAVTGRNGWIASSDEVSIWRPDLSGSRAELRQTFLKDGQRVGLHIAFYRGQTGDSKAIASTNQLVLTTNSRWRRIGGSRPVVDLGGIASHVNTTVVQGSAQRLDVWQWYWADGRVTPYEYEAKLDQALSMLRGHGDSVAWVVLYALDDDGGLKARASLQQFASSMRGPIEETLQRAASE